MTGSKLKTLLKSELAKWIAFGLVYAFAFRHLSRSVLGKCHLAPDQYEHSILSFRFVLSTPAIWHLLLLAAVAVLFRKSLRWKELSPELNLRLLIMGLGFMLLWYLFTLEYNYFLDQNHTLDRWILLALFAAIWFHPLFAPVFFLFAMNFLYQLRFPFHAYSTTDKAIVLQLLAAFHLFLLLHWMIPKKRAQTFLFIALVVIGAHYAHPGLHKVAALWLFHEDLSPLFVSARLHGWVNWMDWPRVDAIARFIDLANPLFLFYAQVIELAGFALLFNRKLTQVVLAGLALLHVGIFAAAGILFWNWIAADLLVVFVLHQARTRPAGLPFNRTFGILSVVLILMAPKVMKTLKLTWFDTPLNYHHEVIAEAVSGKEYVVSRFFFGPYDLPFTQGMLWYVDPDPVATTYFGKVKTAAELKVVQQAFEGRPPAEFPEAASEVEAAIGEVFFDAEKTARLRAFIRRFLSNANRRGNIKTFIPGIQAPYHIWTLDPENAYDFQEPIARFSMVKIKTYITDRPHTLEREVVFTDSVP